MRTNLNTARRFAGAQDNRNRLAALCVVEVDRQKAVLVVMGVEQRELLTAMNHVDSVVDVERHHARRPFVAVIHRSTNACSVGSPSADVAAK